MKAEPDAFAAAAGMLSSAVMTGDVAKTAAPLATAASGNVSFLRSASRLTLTGLTVYCSVT